MFKDVMLELSKQNDLYKPTSFWANASLKIWEEIESIGVENFRKSPMALGYFVPTYGAPGNSLSKDQIEEIKSWILSKNNFHSKAVKMIENSIDGSNAALGDYRVLLAADDVRKKPFLHNFTESSFGNPIEKFLFDGKSYSRSSLNYLLGLVFLKKYLGDSVPKIILEIGGGFGTLAEIYSQSGVADFKYIDVDIPPTSLVAETYLREIFGDDEVFGYRKLKNNQKINISDLPKYSVLQSWQFPKLVGEIDLLVNFISFQEMEPAVVQNYLSLTRRHSPQWVLLRNMREGKQLKKPGEIGVDVPIKTEDYIDYLKEEYDLVGSSILPYGYTTVDHYNSELLLFRKK